MTSRLAFGLGCLVLANLAAAASPEGCLPTGNGYLRARIGGALNLEINWPNATLDCEGSPRPDGSGIRLSFAGPARTDGRRLRIVFGIGSAAEGRLGRGLPTNVTVMFEGEGRVFTTRGDSRCTVDELQQERIGALGGAFRSYRVIGRGFCTEPASDLKGEERIVISRFDFAGRTTFEDDIAPLDTFPKVSVEVRSSAATHHFKAWLADTPERQTQGLMFINELAADQGMLFIHEKPRDVFMWMKNTYIPLDMVFIDEHGRIVNIAAMTEPRSLATISSGAKAKAVLEIKGGEAQRQGLRIGDRLSWKFARS